MSSLCPYCETSISFPDNEFYITCESCKEGISLDGSGNIITEVITEEESPEKELASEVAEEELVSEMAEEEVASEAVEEENAEPAPVSHMEEVSNSELPDDVESFSAQAMSLDFNESCLYDLMISNIDSLEMQKKLISILQDKRLYLDIDIITEQFKNNISGRVSLENLNALKLSYIVQNIYKEVLPVELYWQQKTIE